MTNVRSIDLSFVCPPLCLGWWCLSGKYVLWRVCGTFLVVMLPQIGYLRIAQRVCWLELHLGLPPLWDGQCIGCTRYVTGSINFSTLSELCKIVFISLIADTRERHILYDTTNISFCPRPEGLELSHPKQIGIVCHSFPYMYSVGIRLFDDEEVWRICERHVKFIFCVYFAYYLWGDDHNYKYNLD